MQKHCTYCGKLFELSRRQELKFERGTLFCGRPHQLRWIQQEFAGINAVASREVRGKALRDRVKREGATSYRKMLGRHEHRVVMEKHIGRALLVGEIVHHIDGNKRNNDVSNLLLMTQSEHCRTHSLEYWDKKRKEKMAHESIT